MKNLPKLSFLALTTLLHALVDAQENWVPADFLTVRAGSLPIILSAPHGGRQAIPGIARRQGIGVAQFTTERDNNTAELADLVAGKIAERLGAKPFIIIARFERKYIDANRPEAAAFESAGAKSYYDAYHRAMKAACDKIRLHWSAGLLLDFHGQGAEPDKIFRGTDNGRSVTALQQKFGKESLTGPKSILGQLTIRGYKIDPSGASDDRERRYTGGYTTRSYGSHRRSGIDAIQLEFGTHLRAKSNLERTAGDLTDAIEIFAKTYLPAAPRGNESAGAQP
jgi:N-formylglutamate amidohydrolase